jgi:hypothetical protein
MFKEDLSVYLADFGVPVTAGGKTDKAIFDAPDQDFVGGMQLVTEYEITYPSASFGIIKKGSKVIVNGSSYVAKETRRISDGLWKATGLTPI